MNPDSVVRFPVCSWGWTTVDPPYVRAEDPELDVTAYWSLHLAVRPGEVQATADRFLATGAEVLTGDYCGGDSWEAWAEVPHGDEDRHLVLYLQAAGPNRAVEAAWALIVAVFGDEANAQSWWCSEARDWANLVHTLARS